MEKYLSAGSRIASIRSMANLKQKQFAESIGISPSFLSELESGKTKPSVPILLAIEYKFGYRSEWVLTGDGPLRVSDETGPLCGPLTWQGKAVQEESLSKDFVFVRQVNGKISAGPGVVPDDSVDLLAAFRRDWIKRKGGKPERMSLIKVDGDSMEPTFLSGDLVLVDHGRSNISSLGGIYAIAIDDEIMIKRIQPVSPEKLLVISDNKQYPPFEIVKNQVQINGKVIWYARELEK